MQTKISPQNDKLSIRSTVMEDDMRRRGKEDNHEFVPVPGKVRASLPKQCRLKAVDIISAPVAAARVRTGISDRLVVHFDGKLLPAINGGPHKEERVATLWTRETGIPV